MATNGARNRRRLVRLIALTVLAITALSIWSTRDNAERVVVTGTVVDFRPAKSITIANDQVATLRLELDGRARYEGENAGAPIDSTGVSPGSLVAVWYRNTGERRLVVDRVRVLATQAPQ